MSDSGSVVAYVKKSPYLCCLVKQVQAWTELHFLSLVFFFQTEGTSWLTFSAV